MIGWISGLLSYCSGKRSTDEGAKGVHEQSSEESDQDDGSFEAEIDVEHPEDLSEDDDSPTYSDLPIFFPKGVTSCSCSCWRVIGLTFATLTLPLLALWRLWSWNGLHRFSMVLDESKALSLVVPNCNIDFMEANGSARVEAVYWGAVTHGWRVEDISAEKQVITADVSRHLSRWLPCRVGVFHSFLEEVSVEGTDLEVKGRVTAGRVSMAISSGQVHMEKLAAMAANLSVAHGAISVSLERSRGNATAAVSVDSVYAPVMLNASAMVLLKVEKETEEKATMAAAHIDSKTTVTYKEDGSKLWCSEKSLEEFVRKEDNESQAACEEICNGNPRCNFYVWGPIYHWNGGFRCATFRGCAQRHMYRAGDPTIFKRTSMLTNYYLSEEKQPREELKPVVDVRAKVKEASLMVKVGDFSGAERSGEWQGQKLQLTKHTKEQLLEARSVLEEHKILFVLIMEPADPGMPRGVYQLVSSRYLLDIPIQMLSMLSLTFLQPSLMRLPLVTRGGLGMQGNGSHVALAHLLLEALDARQPGQLIFCPEADCRRAVFFERDFSGELMEQKLDITFTGHNLSCKIGVLCMALVSMMATVCFCSIVEPLAVSRMQSAHHARLWKNHDPCRGDMGIEDQDFRLFVCSTQFPSRSLLLKWQVPQELEFDAVRVERSVVQGRAMSSLEPTKWNNSWSEVPADKVKGARKQQEFELTYTPPPEPPKELLLQRPVFSGNPGVWKQAQGWYEALSRAAWALLFPEPELRRYRVVMLDKEGKILRTSEASRPVQLLPEPRLQDYARLVLQEVILDRKLCFVTSSFKAFAKAQLSQLPRPPKKINDVHRLIFWGEELMVGWQESTETRISFSGKSSSTAPEKLLIKAQQGKEFMVKITYDDWKDQEQLYPIHAGEFPSIPMLLPSISKCSGTKQKWSGTIELLDADKKKQGKDVLFDLVRPLLLPEMKACYASFCLLQQSSMEPVDQDIVTIENRTILVKADERFNYPFEGQPDDLTYIRKPGSYRPVFYDENKKDGEIQAESLRVVVSHRVNEESCPALSATSSIHLCPCDSGNWAWALFWYFAELLVVISPLFGILLLLWHDCLTAEFHLGGFQRSLVENFASLVEDPSTWWHVEVSFNGLLQLGGTLAVSGLLCFIWYLAVDCRLRHEVFCSLCIIAFTIFVAMLSILIGESSDRGARFISLILGFAVLLSLTVHIAAPHCQLRLVEISLKSLLFVVCMGLHLVILSGILIPSKLSTLTTMCVTAVTSVAGTFQQLEKLKEQAESVLSGVAPQLLYEVAHRATKHLPSRRFQVQGPSPMASRDSVKQALGTERCMMEFFFRFLHSYPPQALTDALHELQEEHIKAHVSQALWAGKQLLHQSFEENTLMKTPMRRLKEARKQVKAETHNPGEMVEKLFEKVQRELPKRVDSLSEKLQTVGMQECWEAEKVEDYQLPNLAAWLCTVGSSAEFEERVNVLKQKVTSGGVDKWMNGCLVEMYGPSFVSKLSTCSTSFDQAYERDKEDTWDKQQLQDALQKYACLCILGDEFEKQDKDLEKAFGEFIRKFVPRACRTVKLHYASKAGEKREKRHGVALAKAMICVLGCVLYKPEGKLELFIPIACQVLCPQRVVGSQPKSETDIKAVFKQRRIFWRFLSGERLNKFCSTAMVKRALEKFGVPHSFVGVLLAKHFAPEGMSVTSMAAAVQVACEGLARAAMEKEELKKAQKGKTEENGLISKMGVQILLQALLAPETWKVKAVDLEYAVKHLWPEKTSEAEKGVQKMHRILCDLFKESNESEEGSFSFCDNLHKVSDNLQKVSKNRKTLMFKELTEKHVDEVLAYLLLTRMYPDPKVKLKFPKVDLFGAPQDLTRGSFGVELVEGSAKLRFVPKENSDKNPEQSSASARLKDWIVRLLDNRCRWFWSTAPRSLRILKNVLEVEGSTEKRWTAYKLVYKGSEGKYDENFKRLKEKLLHPYVCVPLKEGEQTIVWVGLRNLGKIMDSLEEMEFTRDESAEGAQSFDLTFPCPDSDPPSMGWGSTKPSKSSPENTSPTCHCHLTCFPYDDHYLRNAFSKAGGRITHSKVLVLDLKSSWDPHHLQDFCCRFDKNRGELAEKDLTFMVTLPMPLKEDKGTSGGTEEREKAVEQKEVQRLCWLDREMFFGSKWQEALEGCKDPECDLNLTHEVEEVKNLLKEEHAKQHHDELLASFEPTEEESKDPPPPEEESKDPAPPSAGEKQGAKPVDGTKSVEGMKPAEDRCKELRDKVVKKVRCPYKVDLMKTASGKPGLLVWPFKTKEIVERRTKGQCKEMNQDIVVDLKIKLAAKDGNPDSASDEEETKEVLDVLNANLINHLKYVSKALQENPIERTKLLAKGFWQLLKELCPENCYVEKESCEHFSWIMGELLQPAPPLYYLADKVYSNIFPTSASTSASSFTELDETFWSNDSTEEYNSAFFTPTETCGWFRNRFSNLFSNLNRRLPRTFLAEVVDSAFRPLPHTVLQKIVENVNIKSEANDDTSGNVVFELKDLLESVERELTTSDAQVPQLNFFLSKDKLEVEWEPEVDLILEGGCVESSDPNKQPISLDLKRAESYPFQTDGSEQQLERLKGCLRECLREKRPEPEVNKLQESTTHRKTWLGQTVKTTPPPGPQQDEAFEKLTVTLNFREARVKFWRSSFQQLLTKCGVARCSASFMEQLFPTDPTETEQAENDEVAKMVGEAMKIPADWLEDGLLLYPNGVVGAVSYMHMQDIDGDQFRAIVKALHLPSDGIADVFHKMDVSGTGRISAVEFCRGVEPMSQLIRKAVLQELGLTDRKITRTIFWGIVGLLLVFVFIFVGARLAPFSDNAFSSLLESGLTAASGLIFFLKSLPEYGVPERLRKLVKAEARRALSLPTEGIEDEKAGANQPLLTDRSDSVLESPKLSRMSSTL